MGQWGVNAGSPEANSRSSLPETIWPVCEQWVRQFQVSSTPGWKHVNSQTLPRLLSEETAEKGVECRSVWPAEAFLTVWIFCGFTFSSHVTCAVIVVLMSDLFLWCINPFGAHSDIVMRDNTLAMKQLRQTRTNMSATFFLSVTRNMPLPHRLVVCMWK